MSEVQKVQECDATIMNKEQNAGAKKEASSLKGEVRKKIILEYKSGV